MAEAPHTTTGARADGESRETVIASLGMWLFIAQEVMFFGGLFLAWTVYRFQHPEAFAAGSALLDRTLGTANTAVLLASSFTMALAVHAGRLGRPRATTTWLGSTAFLGLVFLGLKAVEYAHKLEAGLFPGPDFAMPPTDAAVDAGPLRLFLSLYFAMTGLHALHLAVGVAVVTALMVPAWRGRLGDGLLEGVGLYWHFVDVVWIYLFPLLYLVSSP